MSHIASYLFSMWVIGIYVGGAFRTYADARDLGAGVLGALLFGCAWPVGVGRRIAAWGNVE